MKKVLAALLSALTLTALTALPAHAATTTIPVANASTDVSVDTSTKLVYTGFSPTAQPADDWTSAAGVTKVDPATKVVKSVAFFYSRSNAMSYFVSDVKVSSFSSDLWVLVGGIDIGADCFSTLYQVNKATLATVRQYKLGCTDKVELDPTSRFAYLTEAPYYQDGDVSSPLLKAGTVVAIDGATGAVTRASVPSPATVAPGWMPRYEPTSIAFNRKNYGIYVVGQGKAWVYTTKLKLVHTTALSYPVASRLSVAANPTTNLVYVTDSKKVTEISAPTGNISRTATLAGGSTMVIDTSSNVLYLGTNTVNLSTLKSTGKQTYKVGAVDPTTHARYWVQDPTLYITR